MYSTGARIVPSSSPSFVPVALPLTRHEALGQLFDFSHSLPQPVHNSHIKVSPLSPSAGPPGTRVAVQFVVSPHLNTPVRVRLFFQYCDITSCTLYTDQNSVSSVITALVPMPLGHQPTIPLYLQFLDADEPERVFESIFVGSFSYSSTVPILCPQPQLPSAIPQLIGAPQPSSSLHESIGLVPKTENQLHTSQLPTPSPTPISSRGRSIEFSSSPPNYYSPGSSSSSSSGGDNIFHHFDDGERLVRRTKVPPFLMKEISNSAAPRVELTCPLTDALVEWTQTEVQNGRRLIRFSKVLLDNTLRLSFRPIPQEQFSPSDVVISCISRDTGYFCVTSVDIIILLEKLAGEPFPVEEKNRVRRNLEGLHPETISKNDQQHAEFFSFIMELPEPRPRNIEKDLKVFKWTDLESALGKILCKYVRLPRRLEAAYNKHLEETKKGESKPVPKAPPKLGPNPRRSRTKSSDCDPSYGPPGKRKRARLETSTYPPEPEPEPKSDDYIQLMPTEDMYAYDHSFAPSTPMPTLVPNTPSLPESDTEWHGTSILHSSISSNYNISEETALHFSDTADIPFSGGTVYEASSLSDILHDSAFQSAYQDDC